MNLERANWILKEGRDWHVPWFQECLRLIDRFTHQDDDWLHGNNVKTFKKGTNLCHYVRCCLLWGPGIILLQLLMPVLVVSAAVVTPVMALGFGGYLILWATIGCVAIFAFGMCQLIRWMESTNPGRRFFDWLDGNIIKPISETVGPATGRMSERLSFRNTEGVSFWSMVWTFAVTLKHQICPLIHIEKEE